MKTRILHIIAAFSINSIFIPLLLISTSSAQTQVADLQPQKEAYTEMWWKEGIPAKVTQAPWHRCILGGKFAIVLDTEKLQIPHMGPAKPKSSVAEINALPNAKLTLSITLHGTTYSCEGAEPFSRNTGPRIIESGHFFQRADVTHLIFKSPDGKSLDTEARFETSAWGNRLSLTLYAKPHENSSTPSYAKLNTHSHLDWSQASMSIQLSNSTGKLKQSANHSHKGKVSLVFNPCSMKKLSAKQSVTVSAEERTTDQKLSVNYDHELGWHEIDLSGLKSNQPKKASQHDYIEKVLFTLSNPTEETQAVPLMFHKKRSPSGITGITAMIRDVDGLPTGIPVQISKNWHTQTKSPPHSGTWFRGISVINTPPKSTTQLEFIFSNAHWGGVPAASHSQLSLIGWGGNQLWEQSALGSWGESICYDPDQTLASAFITDVRPLMLRLTPKDKLWKWTGNVGGGDYMKLFTPSGERIYHSSVRTTRHRQGPCLTEVTYEGNLDQKIKHSITTSISRTDDIVRGTYRISMKVNHATPFSRFAIFQIGADTYNMSPEKTMAAGDVTTGLIEQWQTSDGKGNRKSNGNYTKLPTAYLGKTPWFSLHNAEDTDEKKKVLANRGLIIRSWEARLGGKNAAPWVGEYNTSHYNKKFSILDITPPSDVLELLPGDYVEAVIEYIVMPKKADHYYGPSKQLKAALTKAANTHHMISREAKYNSHQVKILKGELQHRFPDIRIKAQQNKAQLKFAGGLGYIPFTFTNLTSHSGYSLNIDGKTLDQSVHGNDFWQTDFDLKTATWSITYNVQFTDRKPHDVELVYTPYTE